ncbi:unnamed protein product [Phytomonas sp. EM1]|nr:unnamed protein product [Phytomonas sp. EM1]|eukprot:CCW60204.1 unnamed protein product [Phytomonas sp. isolate EM1]
MNFPVGYLLIPRQSLKPSEEPLLVDQSPLEAGEQTEPQLKRARVDANGNSGNTSSTPLSNDFPSSSSSTSPELPNLINGKCEGISNPSALPDSITLPRLTLPSLRAALLSYLHDALPHHPSLDDCLVVREEIREEEPTETKTKENQTDETQTQTEGGKYVVWSFHFSMEGVGEGACSPPLPRWIVVADRRLRLRVFHRAAAPSCGVSRGRVLGAPILLVGAGGIGCELLKILHLEGFRHIEVLDLDTIDETNLNRQFLFTAANVGRAKAAVAAAAVRGWAEGRAQRFPTLPDEPSTSSSSASYFPQDVIAYHADIKDPCFDEDFFSRFRAVLNALDNVSARQHVNRMCMRANVPLIESGSMGYNGQVQVILKGCYECYDCYPRPSGQPTFAVCTIHARPTTMVHCVHFAKELYETLFGENSFLREVHPSSEKGEGTATRDGEVEKTGNLNYLREVLLAWWASERGEESISSDPPLSSSSSSPTIPFNTEEDGELRLRRLGEHLLRRIYHDQVEALRRLRTTAAPPPPLFLLLAATRTARSRPRPRRPHPPPRGGNPP